MDFFWIFCFLYYCLRKNTTIKHISPLSTHEILKNIVPSDFEKQIFQNKHQDNHSENSKNIQNGYHNGKNGNLKLRNTNTGTNDEVMEVMTNGDISNGESKTNVSKEQVQTQIELS